MVGSLSIADPHHSLLPTHAEAAAPPSEDAASGPLLPSKVFEGPDGAPGYDSVVRLASCLLSQGTEGLCSGPMQAALWRPFACSSATCTQKIPGFQMNRWGVVLRDYGRIRRLVLGSPGLM
ncbi:hypothetical protein AOLI_G00223170 [Acnodon oligacanthus]